MRGKPSSNWSIRVAIGDRIVTRGLEQAMDHRPDGKRPQFWPRFRWPASHLRLDRRRTAGPSARSARWRFRSEMKTFVPADMTRKANPYKKADHFTKEAKRAGYPARSVFKLEEIDRRVAPPPPGDARARPGRLARELVALRRAEGRPERASPRGRPQAARDGAAPQRDFVQGDALSLDDATFAAARPLRRRPERHGAEHDRQPPRRPDAELRALHARARSWR